MEIKEFKAQTTEKNEKNTKRKTPEKYGTKPLFRDLSLELLT